MITEITTTYMQDDVNVALSVKLDFRNPEGFSYGLISMIERIIRDTDTNPDIVIEHLSNTFAYNEDSDNE